MDLEKGNYTTVARCILLNTNLTDAAKTLLQLCLNNVEGWKLSLNYYKKLLKWSNDKMAGAVENLITEGYMTKDKKPNGKNGFMYIYVISEFGNLNPNKEQPSKEQITESIESEESSEIFVNQEPLQPEIAPEKTESIKEVVEATAEQPISEEDSKDFELRFKEVLTGLIVEYRLTDDFIGKVADYYLIKLDKTKLRKYTTELMHKQITNSIQKNEAIAIKKIESWIDIHNTKGTAIQRKDIAFKTIKYFKERWEFPLEEVEENDVRHRLLIYRTDILGANRVFDSRYQD
jgi:predicted transcriptional regulator